MQKSSFVKMRNNRFVEEGADVMFIMSVHLPRGRMVTVIAILLSLVCIVFLLWKVVPGVRAVNWSAGLPPAATYGEMSAFLNSLGYTAVADVPQEEAEVAVPEIFDQVYEQYEALQREAGFSLEPLRGKTLRRCTFPLDDHPASAQEQVRANLLIFEGRVVGGDISSTSLDGFMQPLSARQ